MELKWTRDKIDHCIRFNGVVHEHELANLELDGLDKMVVESKAETPADILQSLEIIFRRYAEQHDKKEGSDETSRERTSD